MPHVRSQVLVLHGYSTLGESAVQVTAGTSMKSSITCVLSSKLPELEALARQRSQQTFPGASLVKRKSSLIPRAKNTESATKGSSATVPVKGVVAEVLLVGT